MNDKLIDRAKKIKLLLSDCDGVLTDTGTYYSANGEELKRFSIRDGMGIERLQNFTNIKFGIVTGENSQIVLARANKLKLKEVHLGVKDKLSLLHTITDRLNLDSHEVAFIGDDTNDLEIMNEVGFSACPADATSFAKNVSDLILENKGGNGAVRELCEFFIHIHAQKD